MNPARVAFNRSFNTNINVQEFAQDLDVRCRVSSEGQGAERTPSWSTACLPSTDAKWQHYLIGQVGSDG